MTKIDLTGDCIALSETKVGADGGLTVKIIQESWGTSGFYGREMLSRDAPKAWPVGTHMYWNHGTAAEMKARGGVRDLRDLAGVLVERAGWQESGFAGPGVYSRAKPFAGYSETIKELGPHIGVSIHAGGEGIQGEAGGRKGTIVTSIDENNDGLQSVDFVTVAGAGGQYLSMFESARGDGQTTDDEDSTAALKHSAKCRYLDQGYSEEEAERRADIVATGKVAAGDASLGSLLGIAALIADKGGTP
jgi:hypothetical protein